MSISGEPIPGAAPKENTISKLFEIVSSRDSDSLGGSSWREYSTSQRLSGAWGTTVESPFHRYQKVKTIESIDRHFTFIKPRYSQGEITSERGIGNLINSGILGSSTAVILDSGGAHSVAMAVKLAERGWQPVVMFDSEPHPKGSNRSEQELATMLYFAEQLKRIRASGNFRSDSPPVFVMDSHRADSPRDIWTVNNSYSYRSSDLPSAQELQRLGIQKVIYLNEGNQDGRVNRTYQSIDRVNRDLKRVVKDWQGVGIEMVYTGVSPWEESWEKYREHKLSYPDMKPSIYGESSGIAMHTNRERYLLTNKGELKVINESGFSRDMTLEEISKFRDEIARTIALAPEKDKKALRNLFGRFPK